MQVNNEIEFCAKMSNARSKFWVRFLIDSVWLLILSITALTILVLKDNSGHVWLALCFFIPYISFELYSTYKKEKYLLVRIKVDINLDLLELVVNRFDKIHFEKEFQMSTINVELKTLYLGRFYVPNYMLIIREKENVIVRQEANLVWDRYKIQEIAKTLGPLIR